MPDNKLTDNEIVKALECCSVEGHFVCDECPAWVDSHCIGTHKQALDLINRLQAENERLREKCENTQIGYNFAQDDIKTLKKDKYKLQKALNQSEDYRVIAKAEAYKECIAKIENYVKTHCNPYGKPTFDYDTSVKILKYLDYLLKELVGDSNA